MTSNMPSRMCYRQPLFPSSIVSMAIGIVYPDTQQAVLIPQHSIMGSTQEIHKHMLEVHNYVNQKENLELLPQVMLISGRFKKQIPLKSEYWQSPDDGQTIEKYKLAMIDMYLNHYKYYLLVTPFGMNDQNRDVLRSATPLKINNHRTELKEFMCNSNFEVDPSANSAALYELGKPMIYDFIEQKFHDREESMIKDIRVSVG